MIERNATASDTRVRRRLRRLGASLLACAMLGMSAGPAFADAYDPKEAGHPLAILGAFLHPIGVILDYVIFRPAHWIAHQEPIKTLVGHDDDNS